MAERSTNPRKTARADAARRHTEQMAARYGREIEQAAAATVRVEGSPAVEVEGRVPAVSVEARDAVSVISSSAAAAARPSATSRCSTSPPS